MTIIQLKYAIAVSQHKNFTLAAEKCFVTQPTLSMQIHKLEEELGVTIFDRSRKPLQPTDIGIQILEQARTVIIEEKRIEEISRMLSGEKISNEARAAAMQLING